ncbi:MAG: T9SS type A sorting domain-containing protein [Bacteroidia bacterium]|nr:T9SS type A sorting domain-containing protein [Bacteroidia bacterium]
MKKIYLTILSIAIATTAVNAQTCILGENFTGYTGSASALPAGWMGMNLNAAATGNVYTSATSCGPSGVNAFKFTSITAGTTARATLISPSFTVSSYDTVTFWLKGNSLDSVSSLALYIGKDTATMSLVSTYNKASIAVAGQFFSILTYSTDHFVKFVYTKSAGNISFDDFCIKTSTVTSVDNAKRFENVAVRYSNNKLVVNTNATVTLHNIIGQPVMTQKMNANEMLDLSTLNAGIYIVNAVNGTNRTTKKIVVE